MKSKLTLLTVALCFTTAGAEEYELKKALFEQTVKVQGLAVNEAAVEVSITPKIWGDFIVEKVLPQGTKVKKGQQIIWIDTEKVDEYIADKEIERKVDILNLKKAQQELAELKLKTERDLLKAKKNYEREVDNYKYYTEVELPQSFAATKFVAEKSIWGLEYTQEELTQLLKMYEADGLTEDTEEIIVQRAQNSVKSATFDNEVKQKEVKRSLEKSLPRQAEDRRLQHEVAKSAWEFAQINIPRALERKELEVLKLVRADKKKADDLAKVKADRAAMDVKAPADGVLYFGNFKNNAWSRDLAIKTLIRGAKLPQKRAFITIVPQGNATQLVASVDGFTSSRISAKDTGLLKLPSQPYMSSESSVVSIADAPNLQGKWDVVLKLDKAAKLAVGESAQVKFVSYNKADALSIPTKAVKENADGSYSVQLKMADEKQEKVTITLGQSANGKVEVLSGLSEGQVIIYDAK